MLNDLATVTREVNLKKRGTKGRPPSENPMVHTAVVLPRGLLDRLRKDAERSALGLSTEIRQRLVATYERASGDAQTTTLIEFIKLLAESITCDLGKWHENENAKAAFIAGVFEFLRPHGVDSFQSFAERYVIARAPSFKREAEREDAWRTLLDARTVYQQMVQMGRNVEHPEETRDIRSPEESLQSTVHDIARHSDDPETVGRTHARMVMAAQRGFSEPEK